MYIETDNNKLFAATMYMVDGTESDYLSESDIECLTLCSIKELEIALLASEVKHIRKYARPITGSLYLGEKKMVSRYNRILTERVLALDNIDELTDYLQM